MRLISGWDVFSCISEVVPFNGQLCGSVEAFGAFGNGKKATLVDSPDSALTTRADHKLSANSVIIISVVVSVVLVILVGGVLILILVPKRNKVVPRQVEAFSVY